MNNRPSIDMICVIDKSGSMDGEKIELVKDSLKQLLEYLNEKDRLSLIMFDFVGIRLIKLTSCKP